MLVVFGSVNIDLVFSLPVLPGPGETVLGAAYQVAPGGKGANQAVAAARDGASVRFYGCIGRDEFGRMARDSLAAAGVDVTGLREGVRPTGCAAVCTDAAGRNLIAVASGANLDARSEQVPDAVLRPDTTLVLQMECPSVEVAALIGRAKARGCRIVLNLAPALPLDGFVLQAVDVLVLNEGEAAAVAAAHGIEAPEAAGLARRLTGAFGCTSVITLGSLGALAARAGEVWSVGALPIEPVDTTGAGDAFTGVVAAALDRGLPLPEALHRASVAGGLACLAAGAQPSLPAVAAIERRLANLVPATRLP
ncbi:MAG TPA: ribokinase [Alphaproteobacteria bacterium]|nr:ribokinase [Alphaproteobacteria bacterium]